MRSRASRNCGASAAAVSARADPWLFGEYSVADAMYAPVVLRFRTYGAELGAPAREYVATTLADAHMRDWLDAAQRRKLDHRRVRNRAHRRVTRRTE